MPFRKVSRKDLLSGCAETGPDDGLDPRYDRPQTPAKVTNRKALQLCSQVADTLALVLAGEIGDELLRDLLVLSVVPAPNASRLLVTLSPSSAGTDTDLNAIRRQVDRARGRLRNEIATVIHRRRVPELAFQIVS